VEIIILAEIGKISTRFSRLITMSPGNLKKWILGKIKNLIPSIIEIEPIIIKNFATLLIKKFVILFI